MGRGRSDSHGTPLCACHGRPCLGRAGVQPGRNLQATLGKDASEPSLANFVASPCPATMAAVQPRSPQNARLERTPRPLVGVQERRSEGHPSGVDAPLRFDALSLHPVPESPRFTFQMGVPGRKGDTLLFSGAGLILRTQVGLTGCECQPKYSQEPRKCGFFSEQCPEVNRIPSVSSEF